VDLIGLMGQGVPFRKRENIRLTNIEILEMICRFSTVGKTRGQEVMPGLEDVEAIQPS
jgi:hypothetical protein